MKNETCATEVVKRDADTVLVWASLCFHPMKYELVESEAEVREEGNGIFHVTLRFVIKK